MVIEVFLLKHERNCYLWSEKWKSILSTFVGIVVRSLNNHLMMYAILFRNTITKGTFRFFLRRVGGCTQATWLLILELVVWTNSMADLLTDYTVKTNARTDEFKTEICPYSILQ